MLDTTEDYRVYLPDGLPEVFTKKEFAKLTKEGAGSLRLEVLRSAGVIKQVGTQGRSYLYSVDTKE